MSARTPELDPRQIREYLLRRMPDTVRGRFEEAYFRDDVLLDRIEAEEDVLVSDYVLGRLDESDRRRFEQSLLGMPYYQERVRTTSQLKLRASRLSAFARPRKGAPPRRSEKVEADRLFPGRSGLAVAFAVLAVLFVAAVVTSVRLKSELDASRRTTAAPPAPAPQAVVFDASPAAGPHVKRIARDPDVPLLFVAPRTLLRGAAREYRVLVVAADGSLAWESGAHRVADLAPGADLAVEAPAGAPPAGKSAVLLKASGVFDDEVVPLGLVEITETR